MGPAASNWARTAATLELDALLDDELLALETLDAAELLLTELETLEALELAVLALLDEALELVEELLLEEPLVPEAGDVPPPPPPPPHAVSVRHSAVKITAMRLWRVVLMGSPFVFLPLNYPALGSFELVFVF